MLGGRGRTVDAISLANGLLAGLVAITPGSNVLSATDSMVVGVGAAASYLLASAVSEMLSLDDVVEAAAVHAGCGAWGTVALGLLHPHQGLFYVGSARLLPETLPSRLNRRHAQRFRWASLGARAARRLVRRGGLQGASRVCGCYAKRSSPAHWAAGLAAARGNGAALLCTPRTPCPGSRASESQHAPDALPSA